MRLLRIFAVCGAGALAACASDPEPEDSPSTPPPTSPPPSTPPPPPPSGCDMDAILAEHGCSSNGCHGVQNVAGLDLVSDGVAERLVGVPSVNSACGGRPLVDPSTPGDSLLLSLVDPAREVPCSVAMPFGSEGVPEDDVTCFEAWVDTLAAEAPPPPVTEPPDFEAASAESQASKVKSLASGAPLTTAELDVVRAEGQAGLRHLLEGWMSTPAFEAKIGDFFAVALQQRVKGLIGLQFLVRNLGPLQPNFEDMFVRTALRIVQRGEPWSRILTTREWAVTTGVLSGLRYTDAPRTRRETLAAAAFEASDYQDWRFVELVDAAPGETLVDYRDLETLRQVQTRLSLQIPRVGFFSTPAFLGNAETNDDNQFRVTTNQTLIAALGQDFQLSDLTPQPSTAGLDVEHSAPDTPCYGCHRLLDPMRLYFAKEYDIFYRRNPASISAVPAFAFQGVTGAGPEVVDLARALAEHPSFPMAWTAKLCQWANSQPCRLEDPELIRVNEAFIASGLDFRTLVLELLSSPVVTGAEATATYTDRSFLVSITRQSHLCRNLDARLGLTGLCDRRAVGAVLGLVPDDDFARGQVDLVQPAVTSAFHVAGTEQLCGRVALLTVGSVPGLDPAAPGPALLQLVEGVMSLPPNHSRHARALEVLTQHVNDARAGGATASAALRSAFVVACQSPDAMGMGL